MNNIRYMTNNAAFNHIRDHVSISQIRFEVISFMAITKQFFETWQSSCKALLEIGSAEGGNIMLLSKLVQDDGVVISIDPGHYGLRENEEMISDAIAPVRFVYIDGMSTDLDVVKRLTDITDYVDLLFIDGDHKASGVQHDYTTFSKYVRHPGIVAFHDITLDVINSPNETGFPMVKQYWDSVVKKRVPYTEIVSNEVLTDVPGHATTTGIGAVYFT